MDENLASRKGESFLNIGKYDMVVGQYIVRVSYSSKGATDTRLLTGAHFV